MYVIPAYPQLVFRTNPITPPSILSALHSSVASMYSHLCFPSIPPFPLTLQSPDTLDGVFPKAWGQAVPSPPVSTTWAPKSSVCSTGRPWPLVFRRSRCLTQMFSVGTFVFSLQTSPISRAAPFFFLWKDLFSTKKFTQLFLHFIDLPCGMQLKSHLNMTPVFHEETGEVGFRLNCFFRGSGLNMVWGDMLLKCKSCMLLQPELWVLHDYKAAIMKSLISLLEI